MNTGTIGGKPRGFVALPGGVLYLFHSTQDGCSTTSLAKSTDALHHTWTDVLGFSWPDANGMAFGEPVQYGPGQAGSLADSSGTRYIYMYGAKAGVPNKQYLARVSMANSAIENQHNWQYFAGTPANPTWSSVSSAATPVFSDPDHSQSIVVSFDKAIGRYIAYNDHGSQCLDDDGVTPVPCERQVGLFDSPTPWGPWTTFDYEDNFDNTGCGSNCLGQGQAVGWAMMQKWFSSDGLTIWPEYNSTGVWDSLNLIKGTATLAAGSTIKGLSTSTGTPAVVEKLSTADPGSREYIDRDYRWTNVSSYAGKESIILANNDKLNTASNYLTFTLTTGENVCVGWDHAQPLAPFLSGWTNTNTHLTGNTQFDVYKKFFPAGTVQLAGPSWTGSPMNDTYIAFVGC